VENQTEKIIEVMNVKKIYRMGSEKIFAVDDVSFEILKGEFCCLLGTSGSGKSTLLNLMAGIEKISGGQIIIKGKKIHRMNENSLARFRQRYLGFVFQSYNLMNSMTALENVEFPLVFKRVKTKTRRKMARNMLIKVGLKSRMNHKPKEMSGGQQQRVGIARAFVANPEIVFADEPTGNLDTKTAMDVMRLIQGIAKDNNQTIVMVTHDRRVAEFADKIIHILDGKIQSIEYNQKLVESVEYNQKQEESADINTNGDQIVESNMDSDDNAKSENEVEQDKEQLDIETVDKETVDKEESTADCGQETAASKQ
jgi:putative ABC transport system ATP-binding protein